MPYLDRLKALKEEKKLTNTEIARLSNIPLATITRIFNGATPNPTFETFVQIAIALGASLDEIAGLKHPEAPPVDAHIENTLSSYAELLKEKDIRIREKDENIRMLDRELQEERKRKNKLAIAFTGLIAILIVIAFIDMLNGSIGFFRW